MNASLDMFTEQLPFGQHLPTPRAFQERAHQLLRDGFRARKRRQILVAPTGGGKTVVGLRIVKEAVLRGKRAVFACDRTALINQTSARADQYGMDHAIVQANHWRRNNANPFQIVSQQTIGARGWWPEADVYIIDEAHTIYTCTKELLARPGVTVIGLTATPCTDGLGLLYDGLVNAATMAELVADGVLVPMRIKSCVTPDMKGAETSGGEWTAKAAAQRELTIVGDVVSEWAAHGEDRKTIAFGADIAYCTELVQRFNAAGINAAACTSETPPTEAAALMGEFAKADSSIKVLVSVEKLAKGFDQPDIGCVIDARPLRKSLSTAIQMWGRGLRSAEGKTDCILLDFSGNILRFHADFEDVYHNGFAELSTAEKMDGAPRETPSEYERTGCPGCGHKPFVRQCLSCGYLKPSQVETTEAPGQMVEVMIGKKVAAASRADLWAQLATYARSNIRSDKKAGWCWHKYQEITGEKPPRDWSFETTPDVPVTPAVANKLRSLQIRWSRGRAKAEARA